jgi:hypothetical protein
MLSKMKEVKFFQLNGGVSLRLGVAPTRGLNCVTVIKIIVAINTKSSTILFVLFISKFATVETEIWRYTV